MFTTKIDSTGPQDTVILFKDGKEIARIPLDDFFKLSAVQYILRLEAEA